MKREVFFGTVHQNLYPKLLRHELNISFVRSDSLYPCPYFLALENGTFIPNYVLLAGKSQDCVMLCTFSFVVLVLNVAKTEKLERVPTEQFYFLIRQALKGTQPTSVKMNCFNPCGVSVGRSAESFFSQTFGRFIS